MQYAMQCLKNYYCYQELSVPSDTAPAMRASHLVLSVWGQSVFFVLALADSYCLGSEERGCGSMGKYSTGKGMEQQDRVLMINT